MTRRSATIIYWVLFAVFMIIQAVVIRSTVLESFARLERDEARHCVNRFVAQVNTAVDHLERTTHDWAFWDDTYRFATGADSTYAARNLDISTLKTLELNFMAVSRPKGDVRFARGFDLVAGDWVRSPDSLALLVAGLNAIVVDSARREAFGGLCVVDGKPALVACAPVLPSNQQGPAAGTLVFGRFLTPAVVGTMSVNAGATVDLSIYGHEVPAAYAHALRGGLSADSVLVKPVSGDTVRAYTSLRDVNGRSALIIAASMSREIYHHGWVSVVVANHVVTAMLVLFGFVILGLMRTARRTEKSLGDKETYLQAVLQDAHLGIFAIDAKSGEIVDANPGACRMIGAGRAQIVGKPAGSFLAVAAPDSPAQRADGANGASGIDKVLNTVSGRLVPVLSTVSTIVQAGRAVRIESFMDVSQQKAAEAALLQAEKLKSLGVLAGGIAHDFNNLLTGIYGFLSLARTRARSGGSVVEDLAEASKTLQRARHLTRQLLTFAKGGTPVRKPTSVARILNDTVPFALSGSAISAELSVPSDLWVCDVDEHQIAQVIDNIVINARQAMGRSGTIHVSAGNVPAGSALPATLDKGDYVTVRIKDEGSGIAADHLARVFDPFFTTKEKGTGLGLATAYSIVRKHNGDIAIESQVGAGTTVTMHLPALPDAVEAKRDTTQLLTTGEGTVLLVDDDESVLRACGGMLEHMGYLVLRASTGDEAVTRFSSEQPSGRAPHVVIMDLTLKGGKGGVEAIQRLRQLDSSFVSVVTSGYSRDPVLAYPSRYGIEAVLPKPYSYEEMSRVVQDAFALYKKRTAQ